MESSRTLTTQDGTTIAYRIWRMEKPRRLIVLVHGMASNMTRWSEFLEHTSLKDSWDILRLDLRGHGSSSTRKNISMDKWCLDIATIINQEGYDQALVIGHSLGAQIAPQLASRYSSIINGIVLLDPVFHQALHGALRRISVFKPAVSLLIKIIRLLNMIGIHRRHIPHRDLRELDKRTRAELLAPGNHQAMIDHYSSVWADLKYFPTANYFREVLEMIKPLPDLSHMKIPVLVLLSKGVTYTDLGVTKKILAHYLNAEMQIIDAYHWPLTEKPDDVRQAIENWCTRRFNQG